MNNHIKNNINANMKKIIWSISGSDCSGGAGIAADIKTGQVLGAHVCTLITANTSQNSKGLVAINPTPVEVLEQQFITLLNDTMPDAVKVGLIVNEEQLKWLTNTLHVLRKENPSLLIVLDPVGQASSGGIMSTVTKEQLRTILHLIDVLTPNAIEAEHLTHVASTNLTAMASQLLDYGLKQVIIKGGHRFDTYARTGTDNARNQYQVVSDSAFFYNADNQLVEYCVNTPRIATHYSHGGGCSFATAIAVFIAQGYLLRDALTLAKAFMQQGFDFNEGLNDHYGAFEQLPLINQADNFPIINDHISRQYRHCSAFPSLNLSTDEPHALGLYPVVDSIFWLEKLLPLGVEIIQLRLKNVCEKQLTLLIEKAVKLSKQYNTRLFINDYWQLAIQHGAYGVHLGQEDLQTADLQAIADAGIRLGISTHGCYEFLLAQQLQPSYLAVGAIFPTKTKDMTGQIQGIDNLRHILALKQHIPVVAIGGISLSKAQPVLDTGVDAIAVVTAITEAQSHEAAVTAFNKAINTSRKALTISL